VSATLVPDPRRSGGWTLLLDGVEQSYVDTNEPRYLKFDYTRRLASVLDTAAPAGRPLRVLHLGGGGMTMARYVATTRPGSVQTVVERDEKVAGLVRRQLPLPAGEPIAVTLADARETLRGLPAGGFDAVLVDVYVGARIPAGLSSVEFARDAARVLVDGGVFASNLVDLPPLALSRVQAATLRAVFGDVCAIGDLSMLRGRRYGNVVLVGRGRSDGIGAPGLPVEGLPVDRLVRAAHLDAVRGGVLHGATLDAFIGGAAPATDPD
jgi:hypothetical protein